MPPGSLLVRNRSPSPGRRSRLPPTHGLVDLPGGALAIERFERKRLEESIVTSDATVLQYGMDFVNSKPEIKALWAQFPEYYLTADFPDVADPMHGQMHLNCINLSNRKKKKFR